MALTENAAIKASPHASAGGQVGRASPSRRLPLRELGPAATLAALILFFSLASQQFLSIANLKVVLESSAIPVVLVVGLTFILIQGSIDLSIEGVMAASSMLVSLLIANSVTGSDMGWWAILAGACLGSAFGLVNGLVYALLRLPSLIVTLATWFVGLGVATLLFPGRQPQILDERLTRLALDKSLGVSALVFLALVVAVLGWLMQTYTQFGRISYAIGRDEKTTKQSGQRVRLHKILAFALMGLISGVGGIMISAQLAVGNPAAGEGFLFPAVSAAVIGGTLLSGGTGGVLQSIIGVFILEVLRNGMIQLGVDPYLRHVAEGLTIIGALVVGNWSLRARLRIVK
ncbi:ABC transporter permease [Mesorhizobium sp.]|uniref:ABC transporter permease n=1 Tax=Mesorhizobium sp. TaxID=1871066 RepID=UPI000FCB78E3|nr:ABC transporter permease [Mesorhizobium sp.]RUW36806.1 ABC transporter permease [Mesorhizobium sp. M1E.F.Ca.ET.041.01.1.1]RWD84905.1 MAG: ABC transporter permease [Mesorhizobium sp.]RWD90030.1 MAG: ABC transporter permease [Mesorhizobium sp.]TIV54174.1 MAG: ABC transporter permease [Mesorhizobium sp.]